LDTATTITSGLRSKITLGLRRILNNSQSDRVVPAHSFKFTAALQATHKGTAPVLIRIETKAGHGAGKPPTKIIEEASDRWAFLVKTLNMAIGDRLLSS